MKMERNDAEKLLDEFNTHLNGLDEFLDYTNTIKVFLDKKYNNCLEAKPKALHSMKCDENEFYCEHKSYQCLTQCTLCYQMEHKL